MSHFNVAVFSEENGLSVTELLEPYDQDMRVAPYIMWTREEAINAAKKSDPTKTDDECFEWMAEGCITDEKGNIYSTSNPNAKWDWWEEGGRWKNSLRLKDGSKATSAKLKDIDFSVDKKLYNKALRFWDIIVDKKPPKKDEKVPFTIYKEKYYRDFYGDRKTFAKRQSQFTTYAVITPDGTWHELGAMGYFGLGDETPESAHDWDDNYLQRFIVGQNPELVLTIVDCHI